MPAIEWDDRMGIGLDPVDEQHRKLVELINAMADAVARGASRTEVSGFIRQFYDYTARHFQEEESLMDHFTYPQYFNQVRQHLDCSMQALEYHRRYLEEADFDPRELLDYIVRWFKKHTMGIDQTLAGYLRDRGVVGVAGD